MLPKFVFSVLAFFLTTPTLEAFISPLISFPPSPSTQRSSYRCSKTPAKQYDASPSATTSTIPPVQAVSSDHPLIQLANEIIYAKSGFYSPYDSSVFAEDFVFRGPYIGPLNKKDYLQTMDTFGIYKALPDINPNAFGFSIDPKNEKRVWFMVRNSGTFTGEPGIGLGGGNYFPPNGAKLEGCPETFSMTFDESKKLKYLSVGYVADRFEGNTNGKGAAVGIFNVIGLPFPSPGPSLSLAQWFLTEVINMGGRSYSKREEVPQWWLDKSDAKASEGYL
mmetsp:Transcript_310/g.636  ORF Transcript_310/g.636 Transcript_310/m.636 type:complete len:278 (+) Transcript_310:24-857(+)